MEEEILRFDKCPACGSERRAAESERDDLVASGKLQKGAFLAMGRTMRPMIDPQRVLLLVQVPVLLAEYDICLDCGSYYCTQLQKKHAAVQEVKKYGGN